jgi:type II secretory pathway component PulF
MGIQFGKASLSSADRVDFFKTLSGWLNSGGGQMSLAEGVRNTTNAFSIEEYATLAPQMIQIQEDVTSGQTPFYMALTNSGLGFKEQELAIIEAAEKSSQLRQAMPSLVSAMEVQASGRRELVSKLTGPMIIGVLLIIMTFGILLFMLPLVIQPVIDKNPKSVNSFPAILQYFWYTSVWLRANPWPPSIFVVSMIILFLCRNLGPLQPYWLKFTLSWNVTRKMILGFNSMVVVYFLPALVRSGMPTYQVLEQLAGCVSHPVIASLLLVAAEEHKGGLRMAQAVSILPFKASFQNAIEAGEATGKIAERVEDLQMPYKLELERHIRQVTATIKFIVMTVLLPLFIISTYTSLVGPIFALMEYGRS